MLFAILRRFLRKIIHHHHEIHQFLFVILDQQVELLRKMLIINKILMNIEDSIQKLIENSIILILNFIKQSLRFRLILLPYFVLACRSLLINFCDTLFDVMFLLSYTWPVFEQNLDGLPWVYLKKLYQVVEKVQVLVESSVGVIEVLKGVFRLHFEQNLERFGVIFVKFVKPMQYVKFLIVDELRARSYAATSWRASRALLSSSHLLLNTLVHSFNQLLTIDQIRLKVVETPLKLLNESISNQIFKYVCVGFYLKKEANSLRFLWGGNVIWLNWIDLLSGNYVQEVSQKLVLHELLDPESPPELKIFLLCSIDTPVEIDIVVELNVLRYQKL